jgi:hypothetical protein
MAASDKLFAGSIPEIYDRGVIGTQYLIRFDVGEISMMSPKFM